MIRRLVKRLIPTRLYPDWDSALLRCGSGYGDSDIARIVAMKTQRLIGNSPFEASPSSASLLSATSFLGRSGPFRVIDVGGAAGAHYFELQSVLPTPLRVQWVVVETASMAEAARGLMLPADVQYSESLSQATQLMQEAPQVVLASGVLMYLPDPIVALEEIVASGAERLVFTRTGLSPDERTRIIVQESRLSENGSGALPGDLHDRSVRYPNTFVPRRTFENILRSRYDLRLAALETARVWKAGKVWIDQYAYVADLRG